MSWNTYFNVLMKIKGRLFGEQLWFRLMVKPLVHSVKISITIILTLNVFTINIQKNYWIFGGGIGEQEKITPSLVHPTIYSPTGPLTRFVSQPFSCGLENSFYLWVCGPPNHFPVHCTIAFIYEYLCISIYVKYQGTMEFSMFGEKFHVLDFLRIKTCKVL